MNSRIINPQSYIFSAIVYVGKDNFTSNDLAKILIDNFSLQKTFSKAKAFTYNQIQNLVNRGLLKKVKQEGIYQYLYSTTPEFDYAMGCVDLINPVSKISSHEVKHSTHKTNDEIKKILKALIDKYTGELEKISGAKEIYEELIVIVSERGNEFRKLSVEQGKKHIRMSEKINTLSNILDSSFFSE